MRITNALLRIVVLIAFGGLTVLPAASTGQRPATAPTAPIPMTGAAPKGTGFIVGQVVDGTTGAPIGGAIVTMSMSVVGGVPGGRGVGAPPQPAPPPGPGPVSSAVAGQRVMTDGNGRFLFHDLPRGSVTLLASAGGYLSGGYGASRLGSTPRAIDLGEGERKADATIRLWKYAAITGAVLDEYGEPMISVQVRALRRSTAQGQRRWGSPSYTTSTDDRGVFRFSQLNPGDYLVVVPSTSTSVPMSLVDAYSQALATGGGEASTLVRALTSSGAPVPTTLGQRIGDTQLMAGSGLGRMGPPPSSDGHLSIYQTSMYSNALATSQAQVISVASGEERNGIDFSLRLVPGLRVAGVVTGPNGPAVNFGVKLIPAFADEFVSESGLETATTSTDGVGQFVFLGVPAGQYLLKALKAVPQQMVTSMSRTEGPNGQIIVTTTAEAPTDPTLWGQMTVPVSDADVSGLQLALHEGVKFSGRIDFEGGSSRPAGQALQQITISLQPVDTQSGAFNSALRPNADGLFVGNGYLPGRYRVSVNAPGGWTLKSVLIGGRDASIVPITIDSDVTGAIVLLTDRPTRLTCTVRKPLPSDFLPVVVVFPAAYASYGDGGLPGRLVRTARAGAAGNAIVTGLPAGDYLVAAISDDLSGDWQDPKLLEAIAREAQRISLDDGDQTTIDLKPVVIR